MTESPLNNPPLPQIEDVARRVAQLAVSMLPRDKVVLAILRGAVMAVEELESQPHPNDSVMR